MKTSPFPRHDRRLQRGQSTTEFVVIALFVLMPLFIIVPLLGKMQDMFQATELASRYVAFEGMARNSSNSWKSDAELSLEVRRRFFSYSKAPVKTGDVAGDSWADRNPLWTDHAGNPLLAKFEDDVKVHTQVSDKNAIAAAHGLLGFADELNLSKSNWYKAEVSIKIADTPRIKPFDELKLTSTRRTVLLADAWTARSPGQIRSKIEDGGLKTFPLGKAKPLVDAIGLLPTLVYDPALKLGEFDWDIVPCDRLNGGC
ncbi:MAG TPA: hypothetical protein VK195_12410 [Burkholderiaceae bacterium]|nr:hypothetical protein [Burkholderiaceae bacterium]